jgi:hypothetical protein
VSILDALGISEEEVTWHDLAACRNIVEVAYDENGERSVFDPMFDSYENDTAPFSVRKAVDELCLSCPVQKICYDDGVANGEPGVWGGVYLTNGKHDRTRNEHKTKAVWKRIRAGIKNV